MCASHIRQNIALAQILVGPPGPPEQQKQQWAGIISAASSHQTRRTLEEPSSWVSCLEWIILVTPLKRRGDDADRLRESSGNWF